LVIILSFSVLRPAREKEKLVQPRDHPPLARDLSSLSPATSPLSPPPRPVEERGGTSKSRETSIETQRRDRKTRKEDETETHFSFSSSKLKLKKSNNKKNFHL
jgi:hypothetical protein